MRLLYLYFFYSNNVFTVLNKKVKVYFFFGGSYKEIIRNEIKSLTRVHQEFCKNKFIYIMTGKNQPKDIKSNGFSYNINTDEIVSKEQSLSLSAIEEIFKYYSNIFGETFLDTSGHIRFKIKKSKKQYSNSNIVEALSYLGQIGKLFDYHWNEKNTNKKSLEILWINNVQRSLWHKGITNFRGLNINNIPLENKDFYIINKDSIDKESNPILAQVHRNLLNSINYSSENSFLLSLVPHYESEEFLLFFEKNTLYFYMYNMGLEFFKLKKDNFKLTENTNNIDNSLKIEKVGAINNLDKIKETSNDEVNYEQYKNTLDKKLFQVNDIDSNYLGFLMLNIRDKNSFNVMDTSQLLEKIINDSAEEKIYNYNLFNLDSNLFYLFGYQGSMKPYSLPYDRYQHNVKDFNNNKDKKIPKEHLYNIPSYESQENQKIIEEALSFLPQTSPIYINQTGLFLGCLGFYKKFCALLTFEYMILEKFNKPSIGKITNNFYCNFSIGYLITPAIYFGPSLALITSNYVVNNYFDPLLGWFLVIKKNSIIFVLKCHYNITNNTFVTSVNLGLTKLIYGEEEKAINYNLPTTMELL